MTIALCVAVSILALGIVAMWWLGHISGTPPPSDYDQ